MTDPKPDHAPDHQTPSSDAQRLKAELATTSHARHSTTGRRVHLLLFLALPWWAHWLLERTGVVVDAETGSPIAGAQVGIKGSNRRVQTDSRGEFRLPSRARMEDRIVAWKAGYYIAGADLGSDHRTLLRLQEHPQEDDPSYEWVDPNPDPAAEENCANCHEEIYRQWSASAHGRSAVNRHFLDMFYGTDWKGRPNVGWNFSRAHPEARPVCVACHLPTVSADDPAAEDPSRVTGVAREGIHCDFCHKIAESDLGALGLQHGRDALRLMRPGGGQQLFFGPLDDVDRGRDTYSPLYRSSRYCASCHEGTLFGTRAYETFTEWSESSYARQGVECQSCHMKPDGRLRNIAPGHGGIERDPATLATHQFPGSTDDEFLQSCVELQLTGCIEGQLVSAQVAIRPIDVGHRLPTGSPERHLLLVVQAANERGERLAQRSGPTIPAAGGLGMREAGNYAGAPGKLFGKLLEGPDGLIPAPFWQAVTLHSDTRLKPDETDQTELVFERGGSSGSISLRATLLYRRFYKAVRDAKGWPDEDVILGERTLQLEPSL